MKKIIRVTESELIKLIGKVINEQSGVPMMDPTKIPGATFKAPSPNAMNPKGDPTKFTQQAAPNIGCIGLKSPETNKKITGFNGETFVFYNNGRFADVKGQKGNYVCGSQANIVNLMYDSDPKAVKYFNMSPKPAPKAAPAKVKAKPDPKVVELQKELVAYGFLPQSEVDGVMGPITRAAQKRLIQQKGQVALQKLTAQGKDFGEKLKQNVQQYSQPNL